MPQNKSAMRGLFASAACGALCVSNEAVQNEPFQRGLHFIKAPRARMAESISWYLTHEEERRHRAVRALQSFSTDFPLSVSLQKLGSWYLLLIISFVLVTLVNRPRLPDVGERVGQARKKELLDEAI